MGEKKGECEWREKHKCESEEGEGGNVSEETERARKLSEREREKCECGENGEGKWSVRGEREGKEEFGLEERGRKE